MSNSNDTLIIKGDTKNDSITSSGKNASSVEDVHENVSEVKTSDEVNTSDTQTGGGVDKVLDMEFNRANIEALGNMVHLVDSDEEHKLDMFCYVKCDENDNELLKQCRGVVFNGSKIVMKAFPYTIEYNHSEIETINTSLKEFKNWTFYESHEGALVRMFYFNGKWFISTHRKLNSFRSKWASRESFGTSFKAALSAEEENNKAFKNSLPDGDNILDKFQGTLDTNKQYMFLIRNNKDNRIVCSAPERATVYHVGTFVDGELVFTENINLPVPKKLTFLNVDELLMFVNKIDYKHLQGVIGFTSDNKQIKIVHKDYQELFRARGNEPSIKFRYLQVRMNSRYLNMLFHLYPEMSDVFDEYENTLYDIASSIYNSYVQRFIKKRYVTVPRQEFFIIKECHSWHLSNRQENRISVDKVIQVMNQQSPTHLNHMIRRFKLEKIKEKEQDNINTNSVLTGSIIETSPYVRNINPSHNVKSPPILILSKKTKSRILPRKPLYKPKGSNYSGEVEVEVKEKGSNDSGEVDV
jgi:hypothetical protein